jgi:hypothetical protein
MLIVYIFSGVTMYVIEVSTPAPTSLTYVCLANPRILPWPVVSEASGLKYDLGLHAPLLPVYMCQLLRACVYVLTVG